MPSVLSASTSFSNVACDMVSKAFVKSSATRTDLWNGAFFVQAMADLFLNAVEVSCCAVTLPKVVFMIIVNVVRYQWKHQRFDQFAWLKIGIILVVFHICSLSGKCSTMNSRTSPDSLCPIRVCG